MERWQLKQRVSLPRSAKKIHTREVIRDYYTRLNGMVYVSFSGGKDSTMLAYMVLQMFPDVPLVFDDTGLEFPEIKEHVYKTFPAFIERRLGFRPTIVTVRPKMAYPQVIDRYGYPVVSKEQSRYIYQVRHTKSEKLRKARLEGVRGTINPRRIFRKLAERWKYLLTAPFEIGDGCCEAMKKRPMKKYEKESGRHPMIGIMTGDSEARKATYVLMGGCNYFSVKRTSSWPLAIWTEQDMLEEIREEEVPIPTVYGEIVEDFSGDMFSPKLRTSGEDRTGCMFCMFGVHKDGEDNRFTRMKRTHPKIYEFCMRPREQGGLGLARVLDFMKIPH